MGKDLPKMTMMMIDLKQPLFEVQSLTHVLDDFQVSWWGQRTCGSNATASDSRNMGGYNTTSYSCGNYTEAIKHYRVFELGHCWPSGTSKNYDASDVFNQTDRKCLDKALDFTPVVLDFFSKWTLPNAPRN